MPQAWRDTLREAWLRTNRLLQNTIRFLCGQQPPYEEFKTRYGKDNHDRHGE